MLNPPLTHFVESLPVRWCVVFALIFATGAIGFGLTSYGAQFPLPLLPSGIAVAALYRWGLKRWTAVFCAGAAIDLWIGRPFLPALGTGVGLAAGSAFTAWFLRSNDFERSFSRVKDVLIFVVAVAGGMTITPVIGTLGYSMAGLDADSYVMNGLRWWSNTTAGVFLVSPALIAVRRQSFARLALHRLDGAGWLFGVCITCMVILLAPGPIGRSVVIMLAMLLIVVSAIRFGLVVAALGSLAISMIAAFSFTFSVGLFGEFDEFAGRLTLLFFSGTLTGLTLVINALLSERDAAGTERLRAERQYAEIFDNSPQPIWVHDSQTLAFLLVNMAALRQYGWSRAEFLERSVSVLAPPGEPRAPMRRFPEPLETRHVTRDGRILEVEVWSRSIDFGGRPAELVFALDVTERRALGSALIDSIAGEQRRIAQEMHDGLGQEMTGLALSLRALATRADRDRLVMAPDLDELAKLATRCIEGSRRIVQGLSPLNDAGGSLEKALEALARRASLSGTPVRFQMRHSAPLMLQPEQLNHLYRIAQEATQNALKHAAATGIDIELSPTDASVRLSIVDDGTGFSELNERRTGLGMRTMHFRASAIGATLMIDSDPGNGTAVVCETPQAVTMAAAAVHGWRRNL